MKTYNIYTDGSSRGNPGPGGWAAIVMNSDGTEIIHQYACQVDKATNNQMELSAVLYAFQYAAEHPENIYIVYSDSAYVVNSCNEWMRNWAANGWRNSKGNMVENIAYMQQLYSYLKRPFFNAEVRKCSGHTGELGNELADALASNNKKKYAELIEGWDVETDDCDGRCLNCDLFDGLTGNCLKEREYIND